MSWLGKFGLQLNKRSLIGLLIHLPVGLTIVFFFSTLIFLPLYNAIVCCLGGVLLFRSFMRYEETQSTPWMRKTGEPHLDIKGLCWGITLSVYIFIIYSVYIV